MRDARFDREEIDQWELKISKYVSDLVTSFLTTALLKCSYPPEHVNYTFSLCEKIETKWYSF